MENYKQTQTESSERLDDILSYLKISANKLSVELGFSANTKIYHIKNGRNEISAEIASLISNKYPEINYEWILRGEGEMLKTSKRPNLKNEVTPVMEDDYMMVEYVDLATCAGVLGGGIENGVETDTRLIPKEYAKGHYLVVRVSGDSMNDNTNRSLKDGDEILIRQWQEQIEFLPIKKKLFVINTNEGSVVKQITDIDMEKLTITLHSFNPDFEDYKVYFEDIIQIFTVEKIVNSKIIF